MELELVTIGNELLLGFTLDTNAAELATAGRVKGRKAWLAELERRYGVRILQAEEAGDSEGG